MRRAEKGEQSLKRWRQKIERGGDRKSGESDSGSQYFLNSFASTQLGIKAIILGLIPNPTELAAFRDKPGWQPINKAGTDENNVHMRDLLDTNGFFF